MIYVLRYHPNQWTPANVLVNGKVTAVEEQTRWEQLDNAEWLCVTVRQPATGFRRAPYVAEAHLMRDLQSDGKWKGRYPFEATRIALVADAQPSPAPEPPARVETAGTAHIARTAYAVPRGQRLPK